MRLYERPNYATKYVITNNSDRIIAYCRDLSELGRFDNIPNHHTGREIKPNNKEYIFLLEFKTLQDLKEAFPEEFL